MHLMYYLDANGKRAYTLKVCTFSLNGFFACLRGDLVGLVVGVGPGANGGVTDTGTSYTAI